MPRLSANVSFLFAELPLIERFGAAATAGFKAVECNDPYQAPAAVIAQELAGNGLVMNQINTPACEPAEDEVFGLAALPGRESHARDAFQRALDYALRIGATAVHCLAGRVPAGVAWTDAEAVFRANLQWAAALAQYEGLLVMIEPLNARDRPDYLLQSNAQARRIIEELACPNIRLQLDLYHCQISENQTVSAISRNLDILGHVQIAGVPSRSEPDGGELDHLAALALLDDLGYEGWVGCEYHPLRDTFSGLAWARPYLN